MVGKLLTGGLALIAIVAAVAWAGNEAGGPCTSCAVAKPLAAAVPDGLNFTLEDQDGKKVSLADYADKVVVLEWINPECPFVVRHYKAGTMVNLARQYESKGVVWLAINSTAHATKAESKDWIGKHAIPYSILDDAAGTVGKQYSAKTTPHMFIIHRGQVVYQGAIDDDPRGNKADQTVNYVSKALDEVLSGQAVSTAQTKPYGCTVKYKG